MTKEECVKGLKYLSLAYGNNGYSREECEIYYEFLQAYEYDIFRHAVKNIIKSSKFIPKITELVEECEKEKKASKFEIVEFMKQRGYFKAPTEYEKANLFLERGIIPEWLQNDINKYFYIFKQQRIEYKNNILLENNE